MHDNAFLFYITLYANSSFDMPAPRSTVGSKVFATNQVGLTSSPTGIGSTLLLTSSAPDHQGESTVWNSLGVSYSADKYQTAFEIVGLPVYAYGFHCDKAEVFALTNIADLDMHVQMATRNQWWVHRMRAMQALSARFHPARLVSKWQKWSSMDVSKRFAALEATVFQLNHYEPRI